MNSRSAHDGHDGKRSLRKIWGSLFFVGFFGLSAGALVIMASIRDIQAWHLALFVPAALSLVSGLYLMRMISMQNIQSIIHAAKGDRGERPETPPAQS